MSNFNTSRGSSLMIESDHTLHLFEPPAWAPGSFLTSSDEVDMAVATLPVYDPAFYARGESSKLLIDENEDLEELTERTSQVRMMRLTRKTAAYLVTFCGMAAIALGVLAFMHF